MIPTAVQKIIIKLGYFNVTIKIPMFPLFYILGQLTSLLFVVYPYTNLQNTSYTKEYYLVLQIGIEELQQILKNYEFQNYILLLVNIILILSWSKIFIANYTPQQNIDEGIKQSNFDTVLFKGIAILSQLLNTFLIIPFCAIALYALKYSLEKQQIFWAINDIFFLAFMSSLSLVEVCICEGMLYLEGNSSKKTQFTACEYLPYLLHYAQAYIFALTDQSTAMYSQATLYILITCCELYSIIINKAFISPLQINTLFIVQGTGLVVSLSLLFLVESPIIYILLLAPILIVLCIDYQNKSIFYIATSGMTELNLTQLNYYLCRYFSNIQFEFQTDLLLNSILMSQHHKNCRKTKCKCHTQESQSSDSRQLIAIPDIIIEELKEELIVTTKKKCSQLSFRNNFFIICHLISAQQQNGEVHEIYSKIENSKITYEMTTLQVVLWKIFIIIIKQNLYNNLTCKIEHYSKDQTLLSEKINKFVQSESFNYSIKADLINIIQKKIDFQANISSINIKKTPEILQQYYEVVSELEIQERNLRIIYDKFPSQKNQSQLMFFYGEVMQDWQRAFDQLQINAMGDQLNELQSEVDLNKLTNKMAYMIFSFEERRLQIKSFSKKAPSLFGYDQKVFENYRSPNILIPKVIRDIHDKSVEDFLTFGRGYYFRKKAQNICQTKLGFLLNVDFFYDLYFDENQCFRFISFFCGLEESDPSILIDHSLKIQGVNKELFKQLNFNPKNIDTLQIEKTLYTLPANLLFPASIFQEEEKKSQNISFSFPKESLITQLSQQSSYTQKLILLRGGELINYEATVEILRRPSYTIIKLKKIQNSDSFRQCISLDVQSLYEKLLEVNEEDQVMFPYDGTLASPDDPYLQQNMLETQRKTDLKILSENEEGQQIFRYSKQAILYNYSISSGGESENKTIEMLGNVYSHDHQIENQMPGGSQASSMAGLRRSIYYRKYSLFNQLNNSNIISPFFLKIFGLLFLALLSQTVFLVINIIYSDQDFYSLNYYYNSIQINHYFIEPMQKFFLTRYMLQDYQTMQYTNLMTADTVKYHLKFIMPLLIDSYSQFKTNFQDHFQDESFSQFIKDEYVTVKQQTVHYSPIKLQTYNMTLFNAFSLLLDAFYKQQYIYATSATTKGTNPHNTFQYVNYPLFVTIFDKISDQLFEESLSQINMVVTRWLNLVIPISILTSFLFILVSYYFRKFNQILEDFFELSQFIDATAVDHDYSRQQFILQSLKSGSDLIHKYQFNISGKEEFLKTYLKKKSGKQDSKISLLKSSNKSIVISSVPLLLALILFQCQYSLIAGPLTYVGAKYMKKFPETISLFKSFSDIGVYIPAAFSQKEILYFWDYFSYFTPDDKAFFKQQVQKAVDKIANFQEIIIDSNNLQFSEQFISEFESMEKSDLCQLLNSSKYYDFEYYCLNSQAGVLKLGLKPSLTAFNNILKNELAIDFPADRESPPIEELEAVYLCSDVISEITAKMEKDIKGRAFEIEQIYKIVNPVALSFTLLLIVFTYSIIYERQKMKLHRTKLIAYVFPVETIYLNNHFERELRRLAIRAQLI